MVGTRRVIVTVTRPDGSVLDSYTEVLVEDNPDRPIRMADEAIMKVAENIKLFYTLDRPGSIG